MRKGYCPNCDNSTVQKRVLGWNTFFACIVTGGLWFLLIPLYSTRCIICGTPSQYFLGPLGYTGGHWGEFGNFMFQRKIFWLGPIVISLIIICGFILVASYIPAGDPFIHRVFG